jgi:beta-lactamase regulating signal transducer with metallopeptidase domain
MLPVVVLSGIAAVVVKAYTSTRMVFEEAANKAGDMLMLSAPQASEAAGNVATKAADITTAEPNLGLWFFGGAIFSLAVLLIINKIFKK